MRTWVIVGLLLLSAVALAAAGCATTGGPPADPLRCAAVSVQEAAGAVASAGRIASACAPALPSPDGGVR